LNDLDTLGSGNSIAVMLWNIAQSTPIECLGGHTLFVLRSKALDCYGRKRRFTIKQG
jgi:hypothetical protein